jgi:signal transduction histidine kinase
MNNALHYVSKQGCIRIYSVQRENDVRIYVYNSGNQIAQEELDKLWIKFYKVDKARSREYGGNGIGLSIVAATMRAHGKAYGVENVEGGVQFYFDLDIDNGRNNLGVNAEESTAVPDDMEDFGDE